MHVEPVRSARGQAVREDAAVLAERGGGEADGAVVGQGVGVQEDEGVVLQGLLLVHDAEGERG